LALGKANSRKPFLSLFEQFAMQETDIAKSYRQKNKYKQIKMLTSNQQTKKWQNLDVNIDARSEQITKSL